MQYTDQNGLQDTHIGSHTHISWRQQQKGILMMEIYIQYLFGKLLGNILIILQKLYFLIYVLGK